MLIDFIDLLYLIVTMRMKKKILWTLIVDMSYYLKSNF